MLVLLLSPLLAVAQQQQPRGSMVTVGPNVQVSTARPKSPHFELLNAADPTNPDHLMGCSIIYEKAQQRGATIVYSSFDAGKTWSVTLDEKRLTGTGDPICTYAPSRRTSSCSTRPIQPIPTISWDARSSMRRR